MILSSTPSISQFNPHDVPYQYEVLRDLRSEYNYKLGAHEVLLSGSVGSAKSLLMAHIIVTHCLMYPGARVCIGRDALPDLKSTLFQKIKEHMRGDLREGIDYDVNDSTAYVRFSNGSEIIARSWHDKNWEKVRSLELSMIAIEELTENDTDQAYVELSMRVNRLPHVPEQLIIAATNPDSPTHWVYKYFMMTESPTRHVYYSVTTDNKFLPKSYIKKLKEDLDPKMVERMIYGKWIDIAGETIYYQYSRDKHFKQYNYSVNKSYPIRLTFDFNIGEGKPMSCVLSQYIEDHFHFYNQSVIFSANTEQVMEDLWNRGLLPQEQTFIVHGDASGKHRDTRSKVTDYDIILSFLRSKGLKYEFHVSPSNPPIRTRHNLVNGYLCNSEGRVRVSVYKDCPILDEGFLLVKLKTGGQYIEDDSKHYQHATTAAGYEIVYVQQNKDRHNRQQER